MSKKNEEWSKTNSQVLHYERKPARIKEDPKRARARIAVDEYMTEKKLKQEYYYL